MITIKPTTDGSLILELPYCSAGEATGAGFNAPAIGHIRSIINEDEFDDFLIALLEARAKVKKAKAAA